MNLKITAVIAALAVAAGAPAAFAQGEDAGFYLGGGVGQFNAQIDDVDEVDESIDAWDEDDTAFKIFGGYRLNRFLAFELDYIDLGNPSGEVVPGFNVDASVDGFAPYVIGTIPLGEWFEVYGRLGYFFYDATFRTEDAVGGDVTFDEESEDLVWGAGIGGNFGRLNVRFEYERFDFEDVDDADALWLTAAWRF